MKCLIIGDSLAADRPDEIKSENRWPHLIHKNDIIRVVDNKSLIFLTSKGLKKFQKKFLEGFDIIIIQLGIVDCAPRLFSKYESLILNQLPKNIKLPIINFLKTKRKRSTRRRYVQPSRFKINFEEFIAKCNAKIILVEILGSEKYRLYHEEIDRSINEYNAILQKLSNNKDILYLSLNRSLCDTIYLDDGYHLNSSGHEYIAMEIKKLLT